MISIRNVDQQCVQRHPREQIIQQPLRQAKQDGSPFGELHEAQLVPLVSLIQSHSGRKAAKHRLHQLAQQTNLLP